MISNLKTGRFWWETSIVFDEGKLAAFEGKLVVFDKGKLAVFDRKLVVFEGKLVVLDKGKLHSEVYMGKMIRSSVWTIEHVYSHKFTKFLQNTNKKEKN